MDIDKLIHFGQTGLVDSGFSSLLDIDKLIRPVIEPFNVRCFSSLLDIDKLIPLGRAYGDANSFSSLLDIDKLILEAKHTDGENVLVLCWILINLYPKLRRSMKSLF